MNQLTKIIFFAGLLLAGTTAVLGQYQAYDLGSLGTLSIAYGINNSGTIVGSYTNNNIPPGNGVGTHGFVYQNGVASDLGSLGGGYSNAHGINDQGIIVGDAYTTDNASHAYSYQNGVMTDLGTFSGNSGAYVSLAAHINNEGTIVGGVNSLNGGASGAFSYQNGVMSDLGTLGGFATSINGQGTIVGWSAVVIGNNTVIHPFSWQNGVMTDLGTLGGTPPANGPQPEASGINDQGTIVGSATISTGDEHAFSYANGVMTDLGTLGGSSSFARDINNQGAIVGYSYLADNTTFHAFVCQNGVMTDLDPYLAAIGMVGSSHAMAINDLGEIVGDGGNGHAFLLVPTGMGPLEAAAPIFSPAPGTYVIAQNVTITSATPGATIRYTTDGSMPTETNGIIYFRSLFIGQNTFLKAIAYAPGFADSGVSSAIFAINPPPQVVALTFSPPPGVYANVPTVTITSVTPGATIRCTTDGSTPSETNGAIYSVPLSIGTTTAFQAIAYKTGYVDSSIVSATYTVNLPPAPTPIFRPVPGTYLSAQTVAISSIGTIRYTTDGSMPTETNGALSSGPVTYVTISNTSTLQAIAYGDGFGDSPVTSGLYTILPPSSTPTFTPASGTYASGQTVAISSATPGAFIRYTTNGATPTDAIGAIYSGPVPIGNTTMLKAIAYGNGSGDSPLANGLYTITPSLTACLNVLHDFDPRNNGASPPGALVQGGDGNFYGTTYNGGSYNDGTIFKITPAGEITIVISFNSLTNGSYPHSLLAGSDGNLYGLTEYGPEADSSGTVFRLTPDGTLTTLFSFSPGIDEMPISLMQGSDGNFYGSTSDFGSHTDYGTIFRLTPAGTLTTLGTFTGTNGSNPGGLIQGSDGNFYGTTQSGSGNQGTIFKLTPTGILTTLVSFNGANGSQPNPTLLQGNDGNLYGTTSSGGNANEGTAYKLTLDGVLTTLVSFNGANGANPDAGLIQGRDGNFYGTTAGGGSGFLGTVFKLTPTGVLSTLISFAGSNGATPYTAVVQGSDGNLYGTTYNGGIAGSGIVFQLILPPAAAAPIFSPTPGIYSSPQIVTIASATPSTTIRYTTDGSAPSETNGTIYTGSPITISTTTTLQAIAYEPGFTDSAVTTATYTISLPPASVPTFNPVGGTYNNDLSVTIGSATPGVSINYTTDGSTPTETHGTTYTGSPVLINASTTLQAIAFGNGYTDSSISIAPYTMMVAPVTFSPPSGTYAAIQSVTLSTITNGATIRYTIDGSTPTETNGAIYSGPVAISTTTTLQAIAYKTGYSDSLVTNASYVINIPQAAAPAFSPAAGTFASAQKVTITSATRGAMIRYTTDGSTPTETNGMLYSSQVNISSTTMLKAIAYESGFIDSSVTSGLYVITSLPAASLNVIYNFTASNNGGTNPSAGLLQGSDGNFYGTTQNGGDGTVGTVFRMTPAGILTTLVSFNGANGANPTAALVQGSDGNFYGTTLNGGDANNGTVFMMTPAGVLTLLVSFDGNNGAYPYAGLIQGRDGNLYGTTLSGGSTSNGTVFKLTPTGVLTTLASFNGSNGANPQAALMQGSDGNFYGTTNSGGTANDGTVFKLTPAGTLISLASFKGTNGINPVASLVQGSDGNFYGTTASGGSAHDGVIFKITPAGVLTTVVSFKGSNGAYPQGGLIQGSDGNFYGTTNPEAANIANAGTVFKITPTGDLTTLASFNGLNGEQPFASLVRGHDGTFYGTTNIGGISNEGVIFQLIIPQVASPVFSPDAGTYTGAQSVSVSTATNGATIRYTIDGSTPTETHGTVYSNAIDISSTTTLQAIAYKAGFTDSTVSSAVYTIKPTLNFEAESLHYTASGATASVQTDVNSSGGKWVELAGNSTGDHIDFTVPSVPAGTYQLKMEWKGNSDRGILQLSVDGANLGSALDQYSSGQTYPTTTFGNVTFKTTGNHTVRLTVTGKNKSSSGELLSADRFTLVGQ